MAEPTVKQGNKYFANTLYEGNGTAIGSGGKTITGLEFQPDFTWIKNRDAADSHSLYDSSRGVTKQIESDNTSAQTTESEGLTSFTSDGFTLGSLDQVNTNNESFVGWNWKANGGSTTTNDASSTGIGTIDSVYQANTTSGFSIVQYTGTGSAGTIRHGLSVAPSLIIVKNLSQGDAWKVYHHKVASDPQTDYLVLNTTAAPVDDATVWNDTAPTNSVFSIGNHTDVNTNTENYVAYCWNEVEGFSKFGKFVGNGTDTDGPFIYTGFKPSWIVFKANRVTNWYHHDSARNLINPVTVGIDLNASPAEWNGGVYVGNGLDFVSNGFKIRQATGLGYNYTGEEIYYIAFGSHSFLGDGTNPTTAR
jgi:hypothetical protein